MLVFWGVRTKSYISDAHQCDMICSIKCTLFLKEIAWCILGASKQTNPSSTNPSKETKSQNQNRTLLFSNAFNSEQCSSHVQDGLWFESSCTKKYVLFPMRPRFATSKFLSESVCHFLQTKKTQLTKGICVLFRGSRVQTSLEEPAAWFRFPLPPRHL